MNRATVVTHGKPASDGKPVVKSPATEIMPKVHAVPLRGCTGYLITEERLTLIDAGLPGSRKPLARYLEKIGLLWSDTRRGHPEVPNVRSPRRD